MTIVLNKLEIENLDLVSKYPEIKDSSLISGFGSNREHYKLLYILSSYFNNTVIFDIGTYHGHSALAMSKSNNKIISYDVVDVKEKNIDFKNYSNVEFKIENGLETVVDKINASIIVLDIDPKSIYEMDFINKLYLNDYKGILIMDDIYDEKLKNVWNNIPYPKFDISIYGHFFGTGLVLFNKDIVFKYE